MSPSDQTPWVVGIGASGAAGMRDVRAFLHAWKPSCPAAIMVVVHRPPDRPSYLMEALQSRSSIPLVIAQPGAVVRQGTCYLGEPDGHLTLNDFGRVDLTPDHLYRNRTIDLLFHSLARNAAPHVVGVILSGSLDDGSSGLAAIAAAGGLTLAALPDGVAGGDMPDNAVKRCGGVDFRGEPEAIAAEIGKRIVSATSEVDCGMDPAPVT